MVHQKQGIKQGIFFTLTYLWPIAHMDWCPTCWHWLVLRQSLHGAPGAVKMPQPCLLCSALGECTLLHHLCQFLSCGRGFCVGLKTTYNKVSVFYTWLTVVRSVASTHGWCICTGFVWANEWLVCHIQSIAQVICPHGLVGRLAQWLVLFGKKAL